MKSPGIQGARLMPTGQWPADTGTNQSSDMDSSVRTGSHIPERTGSLQDAGWRSTGVTPSGWTLSKRFHTHLHLNATGREVHLMRLQVLNDRHLLFGVIGMPSGDVPSTRIVIASREVRRNRITISRSLGKNLPPLIQLRPPTSDHPLLIKRVPSFW